MKRETGSETGMRRSERGERGRGERQEERERWDGRNREGQCGGNEESSVGSSSETKPETTNNKPTAHIIPDHRHEHHAYATLVGHMLC